MKRKAEAADAADAALVTPEIEALADAVRGRVEPEGMERALAAFREATNAHEGVARRRGRRRDDWRPARRRLPALVSLRVALGAALATATLGGLALAAVPGVLPDPPRPVDVPAETPASPRGVEASRTPDGTPGPTAPDTPSRAPSASAYDPAGRSQEALCHAWTRGNGKHQGEAFRRLAEAAGGEDAVAGYCAPFKKPAPTVAPDRTKKPPAASPSRGRSAEHARGTGRQAS